MAVQTLNSWRTRAACRGPETALFFPPSNTERRDDRDAARVAGQGDLSPVPGAE